jgi:acyl-CoA thioester hydrolase
MSEAGQGETHRFRFPVRVYYEDTDAAGVVYYANYLRYLERARTEWLRALGFEQAELARRLGVAFAVRSLTVNFLKPARLDDALDVVAAVASLGRVQLVFGQEVRRGAEVLVTAQVQVVCVDAVRMKPAPLPAEIRQRFEELS